MKIPALRKDYWVIVIKRRPWIRNVSLALILVFLLSLSGGYYYGFYYLDDLKYDNNQPVDFTKLGRQSFKLTSYVYANNGESIGRFFEQIRDPIKFNEVPKLLQMAFISAEDKRFYKHSGVDFIAVIRAGIGNGLRRIDIKYFKNSGASSIAQQYVRLAYADEIPEFKNRERTFSRKIKEARMAIQIVKRYPKEKILEEMFNLIYFGHGVNGIAEASQRYFGKNIRKDQLTLRETVILVSLNKSPALYCPVFHKPIEPVMEKEMDPVLAVKLREEYENQLTKEVIRLTNASQRYNWVLGRMYDDGHLSQGDYEQALFKPGDLLKLGLITIKPLKNPVYGYSNRMVKEILLTSGHSEEELSQSGGLRIYTTIDPTMQKIASEEFEKHLTAINQSKKPTDRLNGAFIIIEIKSGAILALSGGHDFNETQYNRVLAFRSPGSAFKPFTYAAAIEYFAKDFFDKICNCPFQMRGSGSNQIWAPKNFREENPVPYGQIDLSTGLIRSINLATLNLARSIGIASVIKLANATGVWGNAGLVRDAEGKVWFKKPGYEIKDGLVPLLPTAIGASDVNLLELANAYAVFFRGGLYRRPSLVREVRNTTGDLVFRIEAVDEQRVLSEETSLKMIALMRAVTKIGTAKISMRGIEQPVAVKTGTSNGPRDVSMFGGTPDLVIAIRIGHDDYRIIELPEYMKKISGDSQMQVSGGWVVGPLFRKMVDRIYETRPMTQFPLLVEEQLQNILNHDGN